MYRRQVKIKQKIKNIWAKLKVHPDKALVITGIAGVTIVALITISIILGWDKRFLRSSFSGHVKDAQGNAIAAAQVEFQGESIYTNAEGYFELRDLDYGLHDLKISKNGYETVNEKLRLKRFANRHEFVLKNLEFGELRVNLETDTAFVGTDLLVFLNDQELTLSGQIISTGRVFVGKYALRVETPYYKDMELEVQVLPGENQINLKLLPAADLQFQVSGWRDLEPLKPDQVQVSINEVFSDIDARVSDTGEVYIKDFDISVAEITLKVAKQKYLDALQEIKLKQGLNSLDSFYLMPEAKTILLKQNGSKSEIYAVTYDGQEQTKMLEVNGSCNIMAVGANRAVVRCDNAFYVVSLYYENPVLIANFNQQGEQFTYDFANSQLLIIDNSGAERLAAFNGAQRKVLYTGKESVTGTVGLTNGEVYFSTESAIYKTSYTSNKTEKITDGSFVLRSVSADNSVLLMQSFVSPKESNLWLMRLSDSQTSKITFAAAEFAAPAFLNNEEIIYLKRTSTDWSIQIQNIKSNQSTTVTTPAEALFVLDNASGIIMYTQASQIWLMSLFSDQKVNISD